MFYIRKKNMKTILKPLFIFLVVCLGFISCDKEDTAITPAPAAVVPIEGKWQFTKVGTTFNNQEILMDYEHSPGCSKDYIEILETKVVKTYNYDSQNNCAATTESGTWSRTNNNLVLSYPNQPNKNGDILILTNTTLKVKLVEAGETYILVLTKI